MIISLFQFVQIVHRIKKQTTNDNKELPKINREKITISSKILIFNVYYFTNIPVALHNCFLRGHFVGMEVLIVSWKYCR